MKDYEQAMNKLKEAIMAPIKTTAMYVGLAIAAILAIIATIKVVRCMRKKRKQERQEQNILLMVHRQEATETQL